MTRDNFDKLRARKSLTMPEYADVDFDDLVAHGIELTEYGVRCAECYAHVGTHRDTCSWLNKKIAL